MRILPPALAILLSTLGLAAPPPKAPAKAAEVAPQTTTQLREALIKALRADLVAARKSTQGAPLAVERLAQAIEMINREGELSSGPRLAGRYPDGNQFGTWLGSIQAFGSELSAGLALKLSARLRQDAAKEQELQIFRLETFGKRAAVAVFEAKEAADLDALLGEFSNQLPGLSQGYAEAGGPVGMRLATLQQFIAQWQNHLQLRDSGRKSDALQALRNISGNNRETPWVSRSEFQKRLEEAARLCGRLSAEQLSATLQTLLEKALDADTPKAVDPLLAEARGLQELSQQDDSGRANDRVNATVTFLERWQNVLVASAAADYVEVKQGLQQLTGYDMRSLALPRSRILDRLYELGAAGANYVFLGGRPGGKASATKEKLESPATILERMKTLDDLVANLPAFRKARSVERELDGRNSDSGPDIELGSIAREYLQLKEGLVEKIMVMRTSLESEFPRIADLRRQLVLYGIQAALGDDAEMQPGPEEGPFPYLRRLLKEAREKKDWRLVQRLLEMGSDSFNDPRLRSADTQAIVSYRSALAQDQAGQWAFAVVSYQAALKTGSDWIPLGEIGLRLQQIEKEHPADYQQGVLWAAAPQVSRDFYPRAGYPAGSSSSAPVPIGARSSSPPPETKNELNLRPETPPAAPPSPPRNAAPSAVEANPPTPGPQTK